MPRRPTRPAIAVISILAIGSTVAACASERSEPPTMDEYTDRMDSLCVATQATLDGLPTPPEAISIAEFATAAADAVQAESEAARAVEPPDAVADDHRAFIANTDDQAGTWRDLALVPTDEPDELGRLSETIGQLMLGRDELVLEMGLARCTRAAP